MSDLDKKIEEAFEKWWSTDEMIKNSNQELVNSVKDQFLVVFKAGYLAAMEEMSLHSHKINEIQP